MSTWLRILAWGGLPLLLLILMPVTRGGVDTPPAGERQRIEQILTDLEKRGDGVVDIRCRVEYVEDDRVNLSTRRKWGEILFEITAQNPRFFIRFDRTETDGIKGKREWYLFDGLWLTDAIERTRQVTHRQIARPGEKVDLFDLDKAPFPLPFGQKKDKILEHFEVTLVAPAPGDPADTDHLVCVTKPTSRLARTYTRLEFFVHRDLHLPIRVVMARSAYEDITVTFPDLSAKSINNGLTDKDFAQPREWKKYTIQEEPLPPAEPKSPK